MKTQQTVQLTVNADGLFQSFSQAFNSKEAVVIELIQNGRRAGAKQIWVTYNPGTLAVKDDGQGIADPTALFTLGQSHWDEDLTRRENPFGVGFKGVLFSGDHIRVTSRNWTIASDSASIREQQPIPILPVEQNAQRGTCITVTGFNGLDVNRLKLLLKGYPIPVFINGEPAARPHILDADFSPAPVGRVKRALELLPVAPVYAYYQGVLIYENTTSRWGNNSKHPVIIHLDHRYEPMLPDRHTLTHQAQKAFWEDYTTWLTDQDTSLLQQWAGEEAWDKLWAGYDRLADLKLLHLLNDCPYIPKNRLASYAQYPVNELCCEERTAGYERDLLQKETHPVVVDAGIQVEFQEPLLSGQPWPGEDEGNLAALYCHLKRLPILSLELDAKHWIQPRTIRLATPDVSITVVSEREPAVQTDIDDGGVFRLCDRYILHGPLGDIEVDNLPALFNQTIFLPDRMPAGIDEIAWALQLTDWYFDYVYEGLDKNRLYNDVPGFKSWLLSERANGNVAVILKEILSNADLHLPVGKYDVRITINGTVNVEVTDRQQNFI